jgi:hypothetical protein
LESKRITLRQDILRETDPDREIRVIALKGTPIRNRVATASARSKGIGRRTAVN